MCGSDKCGVDHLSYCKVSLRCVDWINVKWIIFTHAIIYKHIHEIKPHILAGASNLRALLHIIIHTVGRWLIFGYFSSCLRLEFFVFI